MGQVVIYEDHRTILNVLFYLKKESGVFFPLNIILFDNHDDACKPAEEALNKIEHFIREEPDMRQFWDFTEFDLRGLDDDWIKAGMELGLINHVFLFNATESGISFVEAYKTMHFGEKRIYNLGYLWDALSHEGCLDDMSRRSKFNQLWDDFGWDYNAEVGKFRFEPTCNFIVDIDLDCFSTLILDQRIAMPEQILVTKFVSHANIEQFSSLDEFVTHLIEKSVVTTICFEQGYCGGFRQAFYIFQVLDQLFFENQLGA